MRQPIITLMLIVLPLAGCSHVPSVQEAVAPLTYKIDLQQGNVVTQEMVAKLRQGMTQPQVRYVMGSPLVTDPFHPDRWDYVYLYEKRHKVTEHHRLTVIFADGKLARLEGDLEVQDMLSAPDKTPEAPAATTVPATTPTATSGTSAQPAAEVATLVAPAPPATVQTEATKPDVVAAPPDDAAKASTATPAAADNTKTDKPTNEADATKSSEDQKPKQRGFFGRMLDKIGL